MDDPFFTEAEDKFNKRTTARVVRVIKHQTGKTNIPVDRLHKALQAGKRISKNGKIYWETRASRSDINPKKNL